MVKVELYNDVRRIICTRKRKREKVQGKKEKRKVTRHVKMLDQVSKLQFGFSTLCISMF